LGFRKVDMASVRLDCVCKTFGSTDVLRDISLTARDREFLVLVGPSGCGKSTLLRAIAGLETVTRGEIWIGDRSVNHLPPKARDIAMVFQSYALYPHMSVAQNLAFGLRRQGRRWRNPFSAANRQRRQNIRDRIATVAKQLQIEMLLARKPKELSGGQRQRVALGRAMARDPKVFLLDEPLSNLDARLRTETRSQIVQLQQQLQVTTIYVTHDQTEAMTMGDRIAVMRSGVLQQVDTPLNLYRHPANQFVAGFIGSPPMNFIPVCVRGQELQGEYLVQPWPLSDRHSKALYGRQSAILGIRPEHVLPADADALVRTRVNLVEVLGAESNVMMQAGDRPFVARVAAELRYAAGEVAGWTASPHKLYFFDEESGQTLVSPEG
ncbi:MAG: sn-glycerol-3-phosphate ABC transporter ATP-binding protein UgpC, partial [Cyanobacteria bacterium P01_F01_bin.33]